MGLLLLCNGGFMSLATMMSFITHDGVGTDLLVASSITIGVALLLMGINRNNSKSLGTRDGYIVVTFGWILMTLTGMLPYLFSGAIPTITNAFFETMSGYTTTGASILDDIEVVPKGVLFWRSLTHWIGGMGIIVLAIAILPLLGVGGMQLFAAEAPGPSGDKLHPRITDTAKRLWLIYMAYTVIESILLKIAGMNWFDAVNHALSTLSTGGFSTKNASIAYWNDNPAIQWIIIVFMFLAGSNFVLSYYLFRGKIKRIFQDEEFRYYLRYILLFTVMVASIIYYQADVSKSSIDHPMVWGEAESAVRHAIFQILAVVTTTGFVSADYTMWTPFLTVFFFGLMFSGGSAGSTSGGIKVVRHLIAIKNGFMEFKRSLHPNAIIPVRYNNKAVKQQIVFTIIGFFVLYMLFFIIGALGLGALGLDFKTAIGGAATSLGNVGPALGQLSPVNNFNSLPDLGKWWCGILMFIGRLEIFTVVVIFSPFFWKKF